jgi:hypothetical protein
MCPLGLRERETVFGGQIPRDYSVFAVKCKARTFGKYVLELPASADHRQYSVPMLTVSHIRFRFGTRFSALLQNFLKP